MPGCDSQGPNSELGGETDQLSDGGCALDVYGMRRSHQVVGSQKELLRDRELTLAALPADLAVVDVAELATYRQRRGVVEERSRRDLFGTEVIEQRYADRLPHQRSDAATLVRAAQPGARLTGTGHEEVAGMESLTADDDALVADEEIEGPRLRTELGAGPPVVRGHLVPEVGRRGPRDRKRHRVRLVDSIRSQVDEKLDVVVANRRQLDRSGLDPSPNTGQISSSVVIGQVS